MMYKFANNDQNQIQLMLFTSSTSAEDLAKPLKETLVTKILGIVDNQYVGNSLFEDTTSDLDQGDIRSNIDSKDRFKVKFEKEDYIAELTFSTTFNRSIDASPGIVYNVIVDFTVRREDDQPCPDNLLEELLKYFPDGEYEHLPQNLRE